MSYIETNISATRPFLFINIRKNELIEFIDSVEPKFILAMVC